MNKISYFFQRISEHKIFTSIVLASILIAGIVVGLQTSESINNKYGAILLFVDYLVIFIFTIELIINILAQGKYPWRFFKEGWYIFDFIIVVFCYLPFFFPGADTDFFVAFRLIRILRLAKIFEKINYFNQLLEALFRIFPKIFYVSVLLLLLYYIYGVIGTDLFGNFEPELSSILLTMKQLFFVSIEGWSFVYDFEGIKAMIENGYPEWILAVYFITFLFASTLIILNLFIGVITTEMDSVKQDESRGKQRIFRKNHTVILGWSNHIYSFIDEIIEANLSLELAHILILCGKEKNELEGLINENIRKHHTTKIICRTGLPSDLTTLRLANVWNSKSVIILNENSDYANDVYILKVIISLIQTIEPNSLNHFHIVADILTDDIKRIAKEIAGDRLILIDNSEYLSKIIAQTALYPKLTLIYNELVGFKGNEIYIYPIKDFQINMKFIDVAYCYPYSTVIGVFRQDNCIINPNMNFTIEKNDSIVLISEDDSTIKCKQYDYQVYRKEKINNINFNSSNTKNEFLILGINRKINKIIAKINLLVKDYSYINVVSHIDSAADDFNDFLINSDNHLFKKIDSNTFQSEKIYLTFSYGDIWEYNTIVKYFHNNVNHIILLSYDSCHTTFEDSDTLSLLTLLHIEKIMKLNKLETSITIEFIDEKNTELVSNPKQCDFVVSSNLFSSVLANISEEKNLNEVYNILFQDSGSNIYYHKATDIYLKGEEVCFGNIIYHFLINNEIAIGYLINNEKSCLELNPMKNKRYIIDDNDFIIVIA